MSVLPNIDQIISMYWEADRSAVKERFEALFGARGERVESEYRAASDSEPDEADERIESAATPNDTHVAAADLDEELERAFTTLDLSDRVRAMMRFHWHDFDAWTKELAFHYINCLFDRSFTPEHALEGLNRFFGVRAASHLGYSFFPGISFPVDLRDLSYQRFRAILELFGIEFEDAADLYPFEVWQSLSLAVERYRDSHKLDDWQMWALIYDLGPRLLPKLGPYPTDRPPRIWVVATNNRFGEFESIDQHGSEFIGAWAINRQARRGDLALMYCVSPRSAVISVYRCAADAHRDPFGGWNGYRAEITDKIAIPWITFSEMKRDPVIKDWRLVRGNFQGLLQHEVPQEVWERLQTIVAAKDPEAGERLAQFANAAQGTRMIKVSGEQWSELEVEEKLVIPLLTELGWKLDQTMVRQKEMEIKVGSGRPQRVFADFVGHSDALSSQALVVIEVKRRIRTSAELKRAVEQAESYAGKLRCGRFAVAAPEGLWVYDLQFPGQSTEIASVPLDGAVSSAHYAMLRPLIGFEAMRQSRESA